MPDVSGLLRKKLLKKLQYKKEQINTQEQITNKVREESIRITRTQEMECHGLLGKAPTI